MKTLFRWLFWILLGLVLLILLTATAAALLKLPIDLTAFKAPIEMVVENSLKRPVSIEKSIVISTSLKPEFTLKGLRIGNREGFSKDTFMYLDSARIQVELMPLFKRKVHIRNITVRALQVNLVENAKGNVNWAVVPPNSEGGKSLEAEEQKAPGASVDKAKIGGDSIVIKNLDLRDIAVSHDTPENPEPSTYTIEQCRGSMLPGKPLAVDLDGKWMGFPYKVAVSIASLEEVLTENSSWMDIASEVGGARFTLSGNIDLAQAHRSLALKAAMAGENLSSLNDLLKLDLPPFGNYRVETDLVLKKDQFIMNKLDIHTGSSRLHGAAKITRTGGDMTEATVELTSPLVQLNDILFDHWSWSGEKETSATSETPGEDMAGEAAVDNTKTTDTAGNKTLMDPELLAEFDAMLTIRADKVVSGDDNLGGGFLKTTLREGRIAVEPLQLNVPGGSIEVAASFKPGVRKSDASIKAVIRNFDIGVMVRRNKPESSMGGLVNLDMELQSSAATPRQLMANGNGYFDFSGNLENLGAGIIDLWAVNLVAAIVRSTDKNQSQINCAVGRWSVVDGTLTPDSFFIDTSKIRICGRGQVDFKNEYIDLVISPTAKKPQFFNLATPLKVQGSFDDINFGIASGGVLGTAMNVITSPLHVPLSRMTTANIPASGSDACMVELGPQNRTEINVAGCR